VAEVRKTAGEARAEARVDWNRIDATTEADMRRYALEDGEDLDHDQPLVTRNAPRTRSSDEEAGVIAEGALRLGLRPRPTALAQMSKSHCRPPCWRRREVRPFPGGPSQAWTRLDRP
jgi:hypothetical protein